MLDQYQKKRRFERTPEPPPERRAGEGPLVFVVQKHDASHLHYDFRLEVDGVLKSWAVPKGPSLDRKEKRLAVMVEDHPLDYGSFEGAIPEGEYGAGQVIVWDTGTYSPDEGGKLSFDDRAQAEERMRRGLADGKLSFLLLGQKLKGSWTLVRMKWGEKNWLLIKHQDRFADPARDILEEDRSVLSGLTILDVAANRRPTGHPVHGPVKPGDAPGARRTASPRSVAPMLASLASGPFSHPDWVFEPKMDGVRTIAIIHEGRASLLSRANHDETARYSSVAEDLNSQPGRDMVLDGEIVALDEEGRPSFELLQQRMNLSREADLRRAEAQVPVFYYVFDLLYLEGYDLRAVPLQDRQYLLERVLLPTDRVRLVDHFEEEGEAVYEASLANGLEGVIAKRRDSVYEPGRRSHNWLKVKSTLSDDFVIGGFSRGLGNRADTFGALLLGEYDGNGRLVYASHVGTGFTDRALGELRRRLDAIRSEGCPFAETPGRFVNRPYRGSTTWVRPELVAEVKFAQRTGDGSLRAPVFLRLRDDKPPEEVKPTEIVQTLSAGSPGAQQPTNPRAATPRAHEASTPGATTFAGEILQQLETGGEKSVLEIGAHQVPVSNLDKVLWPALEGRRELTKRDLLVYLATVSPYLLPHLRDRPLTLVRYPEGIHGEHFFQKHWDSPLPGFVETVRLYQEHHEGDQEYLLCNNLATLVWLGQVADLELHTWFSRVSPHPDGGHLSRDFAGSKENMESSLLGYPDYLVFDLDPYIYSGREARGAEPELNRKAFEATCRVALWLKEVLDGLSLSSLVKTSGRTGLHIYVPILRQLDYDAVRSVTETIGRFVMRRHPREVTMEWTVARRTGKVFLDYNQNVLGKTLASIYSPRVAPEATASAPLRWDEVGAIYPTDFTILDLPDRLAEVGDLWAGIMEAKQDLKGLVDAVGEGRVILNG